MKRIVGIREAKARFSEYVALARSGAEVVVTDRGRPVVRLVAVVEARAPKTEDDVLDELEAAGFLQPSDGPRRNVELGPLVKTTRPVDITAMVREDRR